jgi:nucleolar protein 56
MYLYRTLIGFVLTNDNNAVRKFYVYEGGYKEAIETNEIIERNGLPKNLENFLTEFKNEEILVIDPNLFEALKSKNYKAKLVTINEEISKFVTSLKDFFIKNYFLAESSYYEYVRNVYLDLVRIKIKEIQKGKDKLIIQSIESLDELDKSINILIGRLQEWYGLHFPELYNKIGENKSYAKLISLQPNRINLDYNTLIKLGFPKPKSIEILEAAKTSLGAEFDEEDLKMIQSFSQRIVDLFELRKSIENYLDELMLSVAPNLTAIAGATIGARLIAKAGGLENLANLPSSTIQVLGAEKALFKHLKYGTKPPKHGIIFQHPYVHSAPKWLRGKIARAIANKISIAARIDAYGQKDISKDLLNELSKKIETIKSQSKQPVKKKVEKAKKHAHS